MAIKVILFTLSAALLMSLSGCSSQKVPPGAADGPAAAPFDGRRFFNRQPTKKGLPDLAKFGWESLTRATPWPDERAVETQAVPLDERGIHVTFINHSTFLIQIDGVTVLTDPIYSERASPVSWAGPKRAHRPGVLFNDLPPIDCILISHDHYDHLDFGTLQRLADQPDTQAIVIAGLGTESVIHRTGFQEVRTLNWGQFTDCGGLTIHFVEVRHRSGRGLLDQMTTLWGGFVIDTPHGPVYFGGDTGYGPHFKTTGERYGPFTLAIIPIGAYEPRWFMKDVHLNPAEAVLAHQDLKAEQSIGAHYGTFQLTLEGIDAPVETLRQEMTEAGLPQSVFWTLEIGETRTIPLSN